MKTMEKNGLTYTNDRVVSAKRKLYKFGKAKLVGLFGSRI